MGAVPTLRDRAGRSDRADIPPVQLLGAHERVHGRTLEDLLAAGPLDRRRALGLLAAIVEAIEASRARGIQPPSPEPARIVIEPDDRDAGAGGRRGGAPLQYVSPERILGRREGAASEVYSLSAVLFHCLTGSVPFPRAPGRAALFWHVHAPRPRPTALRRNLPEAVDGVIARGMAVDPANRHPTARELLEDARHALGTDVGTTPERRGAPDGAAGATAQPARSGGTSRPVVLADAGERRRRVAPAVVAALALATAAAGFAVASALDDPPPSSPVASAGALRLPAPEGWRRAAASSLPPGLALTDPLVLAPVGGPGTRLVAGIATPAASVVLLGRLRASPPAGELVALGEIRARRYRAASLPGHPGPATLYLAPTDRGIATIACLADGASAAASFMSRCAGVASSLRLADGRFTAAGPSGAAAAGLRSALRRLNAARSRLRARFARSRTAAGQATAAGALARAHVGAARTLRSLRLAGLAQPGGQSAVRGLEQAAAAYRAAARAAARGDRRGYAVARASALDADAAVRRALGMLRVVGYGG